MPGIEDTFELSELSPGLNIVVGANGSGKTTIKRAIRAMLWPAENKPSPVLVQSQWSADSGDLFLERDGTKVTWQANGQPCESPPLPEGRLGRCYTPSLQGLLQDSDDDAALARAVQLQMAGGYDIDAVALGDGLKPASRRRSQTEKDLDEVIAEANRKTGEHKMLARQEQSLGELERQRVNARGSAEKLHQIETALKLVDERRRHAEILHQLQEFPVDMGVLYGGELDRLRELDDERARIQTEINDGRLAAQHAEQALAQSGFTDEVPDDAMSQEHFARAGQLVDRERRLENLQREVQGLSSRLNQASERLGVTAGSPPAIDSSTLDRIEKHIHRANQLTDRIDKVNAELAVLTTVDSEETDNPLFATAEKLRAALKGIVQSPVSMWLGVIGGLLLLALGVLLGLSQPLWFLLAAMGLLLAGAAVFFGRARDAAVNRDYVNTLLEQLVQSAQADQSSQNRKSRQQVLEQSLQTLKIEESEVAAERDKLVQHCGFDVACSDLSLQVLGRTLVEYHDADSAHRKCQAEAEHLQTTMGTELGRVNEFLAAFGQPRAVDGLGAQGNVSVLRDSARAWQQAHDKKTEALHVVEKQQQRLAEIDEQRAAVFTDARIAENDEVELRQRIDSLESYREVAATEQSARARVQYLENDLSGATELLELNAQQLGDEKFKCQAQANRYDDLSTEITTIENSIRAAREGQEVQAAVAQCDHLRQRVRDMRDRTLFAEAGQFLLATVSAEHEQQSRPQVLEKASQWFSAFTHYSYSLGIDQRNGSFIAIETQTNRQLALNQLSSGTRVQLLLAVRLAFADAEEQGENVPFILDEALSNSDPERFLAVVRSLITLVKTEGRQVIYLTSQPVDAARWSQVESDVKVFDLDGIRGRPVAPVDALRLPPDSQLPVPDNMKPADYGAAIGVPPLDPLSEVGMVHLYYVMYLDLVSLHDMMVAGITTIGQMLALAETDAARVYLAAEQYDRTGAFSHLTRVFFEGWNVGRGKPVYREVLASGGVSTAYIDGVTAVAADLNGDAQALLAVLDKKSDDRTKGFRTSARDTLEQHLIDEGYLDPNPILTRDELKLRVLTAGTPFIASGKLDKALVSNHFDFLWRCAHG